MYRVIAVSVRKCDVCIMQPGDCNADNTLLHEQYTAVVFNTKTKTTVRKINNFCKARWTCTTTTTTIHEN